MRVLGHLGPSFNFEISMAYSYEAPLRCTKCGTPIEKKAGAKTPKYCVPCRTQQQSDWKERTRSGQRS